MVKFGYIGDNHLINLNKIKYIERTKDGDHDIIDITMEDGEEIHINDFYNTITFETLKNLLN